MAKHLPIVGGHVTGFGATHRDDAWWVGPAVTLGVLLMFIGYTNWALLQGEHYYAAPYLSPFYSPLLFNVPTEPEALQHAWFGTWPAWMPSFVPRTPAALVLAFPALFRFTCYYYRKAYYRAFAGSPPGCAVGPSTSRPYKGETYALLFQNLHRYALYAALCYIPILYYDAFLALFRHGQFGVGVGTVIMFVNATLIAGYTLGCHSFRHLIGGKTDSMSCGKETLKFSLWKRATWFNGRHMNFAWMSLFGVMITDIYIRLVSMGVIHDLNTWN
jgi:hypothetical protein